MPPHVLVEIEEVLQAKKLPHHVAIIMDGNRRWAKKKGVPPMVGHWKGAETLTSIVDSAAHLGVKVLTVYTFSTENWSRKAEEVEALMHLFRTYLLAQKDRMVREGVRLEAIGDLDRLPAEVREAVEEVRAATIQGEKITLVLALNYGGRDDIRRAVVSILEECQAGKLRKEEITEAVISRHLDTASWGDPELLIRTSGESRVSNFLLWQICYTEVYITDVLWPDFSEKELLSALSAFQKRERRAGI